MNLTHLYERVTKQIISLKENWTIVLCKFLSSFYSASEIAEAEGVTRPTVRKRYASFRVPSSVQNRSYYLLLNQDRDDDYHLCRVVAREFLQKCRKNERQSLKPEKTRDIIKDFLLMSKKGISGVSVKYVQNKYEVEYIQAVEYMKLASAYTGFQTIFSYAPNEDGILIPSVVISFSNSSLIIKSKIKIKNKLKEK